MRCLTSPAFLIIFKGRKKKPDVRRDSQTPKGRGDFGTEHFEVFMVIPTTRYGGMGDRGGAEQTCGRLIRKDV